MAADLGAILNTYQTHDRFTAKDCASNDYWLFRNDEVMVYKKRPRVDIDFYMQLFNDVEFEPHEWCHVGNFYNTKIKPYMLREDFKRFCNDPNYLQVFNFDHLMNDASEERYAGDYVYWPKLSARFFGWTLYLKLNFNINLDHGIPLPFHRRLGAVNLLSNQKINLDIGASLTLDNRTLFCNGPYLGDDCKHAVLNVEYRTSNDDDTTTTTIVPMLFSNKYVGARNQVILNYLINNENVVGCKFTDEYSYLGDIDLNRLRISNYEDEDDDSMDVDDAANAPNQKSEMKVSPSSLFKQDFELAIEDCLEKINDYMVEVMPSHGCSSFLIDYLELSEYNTMPYLVINVWQYCLEYVNLHNQYTLEDILMFLYILCSKVCPSDYNELYLTHQIYLNSKDNAQKFFASLNFFSEPQRAIGYYFAIHFAVYKKFSTWDMTSSNVIGCGLDTSTVSFGFFKKIKHNEVSYVFNGKIYEFVKNKKEHEISSMFEKADETQVSVFKFNSIMNFYLTEDGMFDVCTKTYRATCPFLVVSALKKNYISKGKQFVSKEVFNEVFNSMRNDIVLLRTYHAKKFEMQFISLYANLKDCLHAGPKFHAKRVMLLEKMKTNVRWLMAADEQMLVLLMMKLQLNEHLHNIIQEGDDLDVMALQLAVTCQFLWPKAAITSFVWCLLKSLHFFELCFDMMVMQANESFADLRDIRYYKNRKTVIERLHMLVKTNIVSLIDEMDIDGYMREHILGITFTHAEQKTYERWRVIKKINTVYSKYRRVPLKYPVWTDKLIEMNENDDMYTWLTRFYKRIYLKNLINQMTNEQENMLTNFVQGFCYFRVLTNFNTTNSKVIINFCASLAIPTDYEKMCLNITSEPNCGKSSLFELLDKIILVYKSDRKVYDHTAETNSSKIKRFESQLYIMNEAEITTKGYLKNIADSTKFDSANRKYGPEESFYANYKVMITNNEMLYIKDGYDKACSNRIGLIYIDHSFESDIEPFDGSVYECYERKRYHEIKDINMKLKSPVKQFLANVLYYNSDPKTGYVYYKNILKNDKCYKHNKKCLYIYNDRLEALLYVLDIKEVKQTSENETPTRFTESTLIDLITKCVEIVKHMVHYRKREMIDVNSLLSDFRRKYGRSKFYNPETNSYENLTITKSEKYFKNIKPRLKSSVDEHMFV
uniref:Dnahel-1 n=1 Tax=Spodoptera frugiperda granulovirus TaxID=307454 RepID=A0A346QW06_9BBAC|nr:dnahel-1 [Spodoptera frugiperda granulovirus]